MSTVLHVQLLGNFRLAYGDVLLTTVSTARLKSLLAYLLLHRDAPQSRQYLAFLFWPDSSEDQARANLRNLVYHLRRALPDSKDYLLVETQTIQWHPQAAYTLDVEVFARLASKASTRGDLQQAIDFYRGDLLPECYEDWIQPERERLRDIYINALECIIRQLEAERDYSGAITYVQCLLRENPLLEEPYHQLMRLHAANGERAKALHVYHTCSSLLQRELGVEPGPAVQEIYQRLLNLPDAPTNREKQTSLPLIGRQAEWRALHSAWRETSLKQAHCVLLRGDAGIGKTRLVEEMIDWAERQGIPVFTTNCYATEGKLAYAPVTTWLRNRPLPKLNEFWLIEVARLLPELLLEHPDLPRPEPITEGWQKLHLYKGLAHALLQDRSAMVLVIEDLQWCDRETVEWIGYLLQYQAELKPRVRLLLIGTLRTGVIDSDHPLEALLTDLRHRHRLVEIEIESLDLVETDALARQVVGNEMDPGWEQKLFQETEGNPLFVVEMARLLKEQRFNEGKPSPILPSKIQEVIQTRLGQLTPAARELAEVAAVIGRQFTYSVLKQAAGDVEEQVVRNIDELWRKRIVRELGQNAYDFSHEKIREVAYASLSSSRKMLLHRTVALALEKVYATDMDVVSGQIAAQYEQAGMIEKAIPWYRRAANASARFYANQVAIEFYQRALTLHATAQADPVAVSRLSEVAALLNEELGDVLALTRQLNEALPSYQTALGYISSNNPIWQARLYRKIGHNSPDLMEAANIYNHCEEILETQADKTFLEWWYEWIELHLERVWNYHRLGLLPELAELISKLQPIVEKWGTPSQRVRFFVGLSYMDDLIEFLELPDQTVKNLNAALLAAREAGNLADIALVQLTLGAFQIWRDEFEQAEESLMDALRLAERTGDILLKARCLCSLTFLYRRRVLVEEARHYVSLALEATQTAQSAYHIALSQANAAWIAWRDGHLEAARQIAMTALAEPIFAAEQMVWSALWPLVGVLVVQNRIAEAIEYTRRLFACKH